MPRCLQSMVADDLARGAANFDLLQPDYEYHSHNSHPPVTNLPLWEHDGFLKDIGEQSEGYELKMFGIACEFGFLVTKYMVILVRQWNRRNE